jgi:uncharacterized protein
MTGSEEIITFADESFTPAVRGFLHRPGRNSGDAIILAHGAGSNCTSPLLVKIASFFAQRGILVLRCDLAFRQARRYGPPVGTGAEDRKGLRHAVEAVRKLGYTRVLLGGHSYGGRQASMLLAEQQGLVEGLVLFSYPLHPPRRPEQMRTTHFPRLRTRVLFIQGSRDPFASPEEMQSAIQLIAAETCLVIVEGAGHDLKQRTRDHSKSDELLQKLGPAFHEFFSPADRGLAVSPAAPKD